MTRVLFVCLGNICRSPMGEFLMKERVSKEGVSEQFKIASAGTSAEEAGNPIYPPARAELAKHGISCAGKRARKLSAKDYSENDYILAMESRNVAAILRIFGGDPERKVFRLLDFSSNPRDIADPWYSGNFELTYSDIEEGLDAFLNYLREKKKY